MKYSQLYCTVLYCTVLYCTLVNCTVLCCTVQYCTVLYCTVMHCTLLYDTLPSCTVLYCTLLYITVPYCTASNSHGTADCGHRSGPIKSDITTETTITSTVHLTCVCTSAYRARTECGGHVQYIKSTYTTYRAHTEIL